MLRKRSVGALFLQIDVRRRKRYLLNKSRSFSWCLAYLQKELSIVRIMSSLCLFKAVFQIRYKPFSIYHHHHQIIRTTLSSQTLYLLFSLHPFPSAIAPGNPLDCIKCPLRALLVVTGKSTLVFSCFAVHKKTLPIYFSLLSSSAYFVV